ncbi:hypothetical protein PR202_gb02718 [Eleusine coracana subsp. coracana]|uniref:Uncharacterized protein n=1 Tax=Eleusine coracana subsp. coracana TaxID=191504 RepID=A0AAV5DXN6_ELECO|nr:hypothetical protein PR202_gb02718 [Eleusine coracana subsp. coracana]
MEGRASSDGQASEAREAGETMSSSYCRCSSPHSTTGPSFSISDSRGDRGTTPSWGRDPPAIAAAREGPLPSARRVDPCSLARRLHQRPMRPSSEATADSPLQDLDLDRRGTVTESEGRRLESSRRPSALLRTRARWRTSARERGRRATRARGPAAPQDPGTAAPHEPTPGAAPPEPTPELAPSPTSPDRPRGGANGCRVPVGGGGLVSSPDRRGAPRWPARAPKW